MEKPEHLTQTIQIAGDDYLEVVDETCVRLLEVFDKSSALEKTLLGFDKQCLLDAFLCGRVSLVADLIDSIAKGKIEIKFECVPEAKGKNRIIFKIFHD